LNQKHIHVLFKVGGQIVLVGEENKGFFDVRDIRETSETPKDTHKETPYVERKETIINPTNISIEKQVLAKLVSELWIADKLKDGDPEVTGLRRWIRDMLPMEADEIKVIGADGMTTPEQVAKKKV